MKQIFRSNKLALALVSTMAVALALTACGGGGGGGSGEVTTVSVDANALSRPAYIKQADSICEKAIEELQHVGKEFAKKRTSTSTAALKAQLSEFVRGYIVPRYEETIAEVTALGAPKGDEKKVEDIFETFRRALVKAQAEPAKTFGIPLFEKAADLANEFGFERCGRLT